MRSALRSREGDSLLLVAWKAPTGVLGNGAIRVANEAQHFQRSRAGSCKSHLVSVIDLNRHARHHGVAGDVFCGREWAVPWATGPAAVRNWDEVGVSQIAFGDIRAGSARGRPWVAVMSRGRALAGESGPRGSQRGGRAAHALPSSLPVATTCLGLSSLPLLWRRYGRPVDRKEKRPFCLHPCAEDLTLATLRLQEARWQLIFDSTMATAHS